MFANYFYLVTTLIIFSTYTPEKDYEFSVTHLLLILLSFVLYRFFIDLRLKKLYHIFSTDTVPLETQIEFNNISLHSMITALLFFSLSVWLLHFKDIVVILPFIPEIVFLQELTGLALFFGYLLIFWRRSYPYYSILSKSSTGVKSYTLSQLKFHVPLLAPWFLLSLTFYLLDYILHLSGLSISYKIRDFTVLPLSILLISMFLPLIIQKMWNCKPLPEGELREELISFCKSNGLKFNNLLLWNIFDGTMLTAGIMGIITKFRYILITPMMFVYLNVNELKSVLAHEIGHYKNNHLTFYLLFFFGFFLIVMNYREILLIMIAHTRLIDLLFYFNFIGNEKSSFSFFWMTLPLICFFLVYFRLFFGILSRAFEREADLNSHIAMGSGSGLISSLEKIGVIKGNIRNLPSWHHYSIKERVDFINDCAVDPALIGKHKKKVKKIKTGYILFLLLLMFATVFIQNVDTEEQLRFVLGERLLLSELKKGEESYEVHYLLASLYTEKGMKFKAEAHYLKSLEIESKGTEALNNLAWLYATTESPALQKYSKALVLAKKALKLSRAPHILDTAAEAYYKLGNHKKAVELEEEAISKATDNIEFYKKQLKKFRGVQ